MNGCVIQLVYDTMEGSLDVWLIEWMFVRMERWLDEAVIFLMDE